MDKLNRDLDLSSQVKNFNEHHTALEGTLQPGDLASCFSQANNQPDNKAAP